jgi:hypothetical protein
VDDRHFLKLRQCSGPTSGEDVGAHVDTVELVQVALVGNGKRDALLFGVAGGGGEMLRLSERSDFSR